MHRRLKMLTALLLASPSLLVQSTRTYHYPNDGQECNIAQYGNNVTVAMQDCCSKGGGTVIGTSCFAFARFHRDDFKVFRFLNFFLRYVVPPGTYVQKPIDFQCSNLQLLLQPGAKIVASSDR